MKNVIKLALGAVVLGVVGLTSCGKSWSPIPDDATTITVAASPSPHAEILEAAKPIFESKGYTLIIKQYTDYVQPNIATENGSVDANYFQHTPYLNSFNEENNTHLVSVGKVHYEPFAIYKCKKNSLEELSDGDTILVPNDTTNEARALNLLADAGLITLKNGVGLEATKLDITSNPHNFNIKELEAQQIASNRVDAAIAVINGNYALDAGLTSSDAIRYESSDSLAADTYANVLCVRDGNQNHKAIKALYEVLTSDKIKEFIKTRYNGAVLAI